MKRSNRLCSVLLALVMALGVLPTAALAEGDATDKYSGPVATPADLQYVDADATITLAADGGQGATKILYGINDDPVTTEYSGGIALNAALFTGTQPNMGNYVTITAKVVDDSDKAWDDSDEVAFRFYKVPAVSPIATVRAGTTGDIVTVQGVVTYKVESSIVGLQDDASGSGHGISVGAVGAFGDVDVGDSLQVTGLLVVNSNGNLTLAARGIEIVDNTGGLLEYGAIRKIAAIGGITAQIVGLDALGNDYQAMRVTVQNAEMRTRGADGESADHIIGRGGDTAILRANLAEGEYPQNSCLTVTDAVYDYSYDGWKLMGGTLSDGVAPPTASVDSGKYISPGASVTLSSTTPGATFSYTTQQGADSPGGTMTTNPVTVSFGAADSFTITAKATHVSHGDSEAMTATYHRVPSVSSNRAGGTVDAGTPVTLTLSKTLLPGKTAAIYYTTDGTPPDTGDTLYSGPVALNDAATTLKAAAYVASDDAWSDVLTLTYTVLQPLGAITATPEGEVKLGQKIALAVADAPGGETFQFRYAAGEDWQTYHPVSNPPVITEDCTLHVRVMATGYQTKTAGFDYTVSERAEAPDPLNYLSGSYLLDDSVVKLISLTEGASVYYTTDGTDPTTSSPLYDELAGVVLDFQSNSTIAIKAIAVKDGFSDSEVSTLPYHKITSNAEAKAIDAARAMVKGVVTFNMSGILIAIQPSTAPQGHGVLLSSYYDDQFDGISVGDEVVAYGRLHSLMAGAGNAVMSVSSIEKTGVTISPIAATDLTATPEALFADEQYTGIFVRLDGAYIEAMVDNQYEHSYVVSLGGYTIHVMAEDTLKAPGDLPAAVGDTLDMTGAPLYTNSDVYFVTAPPYVTVTPKSADTPSKPTSNLPTQSYVDENAVITLTAGESEAIYYTTDGTDPTTASAAYSDGIDLGTFGSSITVRAIAHNGTHASAVATFVYHKTPAAETIATVCAGAVGTVYTIVGEATYEVDYAAVTVQDATAGIVVRSEGDMELYTLVGEELQVTGRLANENGRMTLITVDATLVETADVAAAKTGSVRALGTDTITLTPATRTIAALTSGDQSMLVSLENVRVTEENGYPHFIEREGSSISFSSDAQLQEGDWISLTGVLWWDTDSSGRAVLAITTAEGAAPPVASPADGHIFPTGGGDVTLTADAGAAIYYTVNGSTPTSGSTPYTGAITVSVNNTTIKAIAIQNGVESIVTTATYAIAPQTAAPTASPVDDSFVTDGTRIALAGAGADDLYFAVGASPSFSKYDSIDGVVVDFSGGDTFTLHAYAVKAGEAQSDTVTFTYKRVPAPVFSPAVGAVSSGTAVTIAAPGGLAVPLGGSLELWYTVDGSDPRVSGVNQAIVPIPSITAATTVRAVLRLIEGGGWDAWSEVAVGGYTIHSSAPYTPTPPAEEKITEDDIVENEETGTLEVNLEDGKTALDAAANDRLVEENAEKPILLSGNGLTLLIPAGTLREGADINAMLLDASQAKEGSVIRVTTPDGAVYYLPFAWVGDGALSYLATLEGIYELVDNPKEFADAEEVPDWAGSAIDFVAAREIFIGNDKGEFDGGADMSRSMVIAVLCRIAGADTGGGYQGIFGDMDEDNWAAPYAEWGAAMGIVQGDGADFHGDSAVSREQLCLMLSRFIDALGLELPEVEQDDSMLEQYGDLSEVSDWARDAVIRMIRLGILHGKDGGVIDPAGSASRYEMAIILQNFIKAVTDAI